MSIALDLGSLKVRIEACRGCGAKIFFAKTPADKTVPLDLAPHDDGSYIVADRDPLQLAKYDAMLHAGCERYVSHFITCPKREQFSKHRKGRQT